MLLLGIDVGTSSIKVSVVDGASQKTIAAAQYPDTENEIISLQPGWAEQDPEQWWSDVQHAIKKVNHSGKYNPKDIGAIGISYQMHGLVLLDKKGRVLRNSIIWCDSRAVPYGDAAFASIGQQQCLECLLNSPGNFTAAKLAWVKENEPALYAQIDKIMLPGDFIAQRLSDTITTTSSALSEGIFWDFSTNTISHDVLNYFGFDQALFPAIKNVFEPHGFLTNEVAENLGLQVGIPITYKAGDQPNNALSLNVLQPGEVAATAGTSGVIYGVSDQLMYDTQSRVNSFAHVNHSTTAPRIGVLLCINGTGILNRWIKTIAGQHISYNEMNAQAAGIAPGSGGVMMLPFGNGAERILNNAVIGSHIHNIDFNQHTTAHLFNAAQEGIAFAFRYGLDIMQKSGMQPAIIRAGKANMFLSEVFTNAFVNATNKPVQLYACDGSVGAAMGAGIGVNFYKNAADAFTKQEVLSTIEPTNHQQYDELYAAWKNVLETHMSTKDL